MNEALLMITKHCKPSSKEILALKSSDLCLDYEANELTVRFMDRDCVVSDSRAIFEISNYNRELLRKTQDQHAVLFPFSRTTLFSRIKKITGKTLLEYTKQ